MKGIINKPLFFTLLNKKPSPTDPKIEAMSFVIGINPEYYSRSFLDLKYKGSQSMSPKITDLTRAIVKVDIIILGSLKTPIIVKGVYETFSGS